MKSRICRILTVFILFTTFLMTVPKLATAAAYSIWPNPVTPGFSYDNPQPIELGLKFRSDVEGYVSGVRFFKAAGATGTHIGRLWTAGGTKLAEVTFTNETASGWQPATFDTPVAIQANTTYIISYYVADGNRRFSDTFDYFAASGVDNSPLHALRGGVDGANGVDSDTGGFFNQNYRSSNYWVDLVFYAGADTIPPTVSGVVPASGMTGVPVATNVNVTFSEAMDASTITASTIQLLDPSSIIVAATVSYNPTTRTATLAPASTLNQSTIYTLRLPAGGVKDLGGNAIAIEYTSTFTTSEAPLQSYSIWPNPVTPGFSYDNPQPIELGLKFRSDVEGYVSGVRFFKAAGATGTHIGRLWTAGGTKLAEVTFTNETASGWQPATFDTPVAIQANTTYIISYYVADGNRRFSDTFDYFAASGVDNSPLHALRGGVDGANGVDSDTGGFFNQNYRSSNYWVDLVFYAGADTIPPTVSGVVPASGMTGVPVATNVNVTFSEAMDASTITASTIQLLDPSSIIVAATVSYNPTTRTATLAPASTLNQSTIYTLRLPAGGVKDLGGNAIAIEYTSTFTTEALDITPPTVSGVVPASGMTGVPVATNVNVTFSEAMDASTITASTIQLLDPSSIIVAATVSYNPTTRTATLAPASTLNQSTIYTLRLPAGGVKDLGGNAIAIEYTSTFTTEALDITPPTVSSVKPIDGASRLRLATNATVYFSKGMDTNTINTNTFELRDASNNIVPVTITYSNTESSATLDLTHDLVNLMTYTARVKGGQNGVKDVAGNALSADFTWSFSTLGQRFPVDQAPGGPILIISSSANLFSRYYIEILRTEGFNEFDSIDILQVTPQVLSNYDIVILGDMAITAEQVTTITDWVNGGGHLIAMRPDKQLTGLLGLADASSTVSDRYLSIDTSVSPGNGIVSQTLQFHGTADQYNLNGATALATIYADAATATPYPAVTLRSVGLNGGQAAAFTFDLARSIVYTHQGNPAWQINHVNPFQTYGTALDLFYDSTKPWIDFSRISIPQADEQQRFLANLILHMNSDKKPLPRFWYFPKGKKAVIVLSGDDHNGELVVNGYTKQYFARHEAQSPPGCSVADWECVRSSSYMVSGSLSSLNSLTDAEAAIYTAKGFEVGLHAEAQPTGSCNTWPSDMPAQYANQLNGFMLKYASIPVQGSERSHCYSWFGYTGGPSWHGYAGGPEIEANLGIRLDTNISYNPSNWATINPGYQTGSVMMMRFAQVDTNGEMKSFLDIYNAGTQITDDNGQGSSYVRTIVDSFLDAANGQQGFYGGIVINMHADNYYEWSYDGSDQVVASAQARGVPIVSGRQMVDWLDGRNSSSFGSITWDGTMLGFTVTSDTRARNLQAMLPIKTGTGFLSEIMEDGSPVSYTTQTIKGIEYAFFSAKGGSYTATYTRDDITPPTVSGVVPASGMTGVPVATNVNVTFSEAMDASTITASTIQLLDPSSIIVAATVSYNPTTRTATLAPASTLNQSTIYTLRLPAGGVKDLGGNAIAIEYTSTFTTSEAPLQSYSIWPNPVTPGFSYDNPQPIELGLKFRSDVEGYVSGVRFFKAAGATGTHIGRLWTAGGTKLAEVTFTNETASGWQPATFDTPVAIQANTTYIISYYVADGNRRFSDTFDHFAASGVDNSPLHALRGGVDGANGVYSDTGGFFNQNYRSSNYWVDLVFYVMSTTSSLQTPNLLSSSLNQDAPSQSTPVSEGINVAAGRYGHTTTLLMDGRILIVGGANSNGALAEVESFDPGRSETLSLPGLISARLSHTATRLLDDRVLVVGGQDFTGVLTSTEFFDPLTNQWTAGPNLNAGRSDHTATLLADGRLLIVGGDPDGTSEIFDPVSNMFTAVRLSRLNTARAWHSALRLRDGKVLVIGGTDANGFALQSAEIFDPATQRFSLVGGNLCAARVKPDVRLLPDGKVQVIGGDSEGTFELFNAADNSTGPKFSAKVRALNSSNSVEQVMQAQTRAAIIYAGSTAVGATPEVLDVLNRDRYAVTEIQHTKPHVFQILISGGVRKDNKYFEQIIDSSYLLDASPALITTDYINYAPGSDVKVSGTGWESGETIHFMLHREKQGQTPIDITLLSLQADNEGRLVDELIFNVVEPEEINVTYTLTAVGAISGFTAQTAFTCNIP